MQFPSANVSICRSRRGWIEKAAVWLAMVLLSGSVEVARATPLLEEGFNYPAGGNLAGNGGWTGTSGTTLSIMASNLTIPLLRETAPAGNLLRAGGGGGINYRAFSQTAVSGGAVYGSFLLNCVSTPTNAQFVCALLSSGVTSPNQPDDPLDLYIVGLTNTNGFTFQVGHTGDDPMRASGALSMNQTHLIVFKYLFGGPGRCSIYFDPTPGQPEPVTSNAITQNEGLDAANLQTILFNAPGSSALYYFDTLRIGTTWADVTPIANPLTISGPTDQHICTGSPVQFSANVTGTAPFTFQWRTNGSAIAGATLSSFSIASPSAVDAAAVYDVVVHDSYGAMTSRVASVSINVGPPLISVSPQRQLVPPGTGATLSVQTTGVPLTYQWRTNGVAIAGATNSSYSIAAPVAADFASSYDVVIANACGAVTSSAVALVPLHQFYPADALPAFFGGMNLVATAPQGSMLFAWSCPDPLVALTNWTLEGQLSETPLNDGSGNSRFSITEAPVNSPMYYVIGESVAPPYVQPVPLDGLTNDGNGNYAAFNGTQFMIAPPQLLVTMTHNILQLGTVLDPGVPYTIEMTTNLIPPISWSVVATNVVDLSGLVQFGKTASNRFEFYRIHGP